MSRILIIRLSALGDVAMLIPVLYSVAVKYPQDEFILATKSNLVPLFERKPSNVKVIPVSTKDKHKGIYGLWKLNLELSKQKPDLVADMHNVIRSKELRFFFFFKGKKISVIDKGRQEKKALTSRYNKVFEPLKSTIQRYEDVFLRLGYKFTIDFQTIFDFGPREFKEIESFTGEKKKNWIGFAPFAKHKGKLYPLRESEILLQQLSSIPDLKIFLFGGKDESPLLESWAQKYEHVVSVAGHFALSSELLLMSYLDLMVTMDSGNMHMASLVKTPVVSIWGATHPYAGFYGFGQDPANAIQANLECRPCSVFGNTPCFRNDYACMKMILSETVVKKVLSNLRKASGNSNRV